jgi:hypothetical protein
MAFFMGLSLNFDFPYRPSNLMNLERLRSAQVKVVFQQIMGLPLIFGNSPQLGLFWSIGCTVTATKQTILRTKLFYNQPFRLKSYKTDKFLDLSKKTTSFLLFVSINL